MGFGNIGIGELMMIFLVIMMVFGPKRLPGIARDMGKFLRDFRRETNAAIKELKDGIEPINVGIFDEPDAGAAKVVAGNGEATTAMPGVAAAGGAGVATAQISNTGDTGPNGARKPAVKRKGPSAPARKPATRSSATRRKPAATPAAKKKRPPSSKAKTSAARSRPARKR